MDIPEIDLSPDRDEAVVVQELTEAFTTIGFATLINHGVELVQIQKAFQASKGFFALPNNTKQKYKFQGHASNRGYIGAGSETHDLEDDCPPDSKETFDIGKDEEEEDSDGGTNVWPEELADTMFRQDLLDYFQTMDALYLRLMKWVGMGLQLPNAATLVEQCNAQHENLRLLHYPSLKEEEEESSSSSPSVVRRVRGNVHTDFGTLTLLVQDQVGGLQVQHRDGTWMMVQPVPDAIIVNVGDMLMRWTNDQFKATLHKVVTPSATTNTTTTSNTADNEEKETVFLMIPERYSIAFFCNANKDTMIECLESCCRDEPAKYPPVNAHDYLTQRLADTITGTTPGTTNK